MQDGLDVIVRFHDVGRLNELDRCLFSLVGQVYRPLTVHLMCQRFSADQLAKLDAGLAATPRLQPPIELSVVNFTDDEPHDARSVLINLGIARANRRYLAFLDYDDVMYAEGYAKLIGQLRNTGHAIAFGGIASKFVGVYDDVLLTMEKKSHYRGDGLRGLFIDNFCPLHSYVVDRSKVDASDLYFDTTMSVLEDYDFLLRICSQYMSSFALKDVLIGDYYFKDDGSNTTLLSSTATEERRASWENSRRTVTERKRAMYVALSVQRSLGLPQLDSALTVAALAES